MSGPGTAAAGVRKATFRTPDALKVAFLTVRASPVVAGPARYGRTVAAELADPLTPLLGTGAAATAVLGEATDAVLVGGAMVGSSAAAQASSLPAATATVTPSSMRPRIAASTFSPAGPLRLRFATAGVIPVALHRGRGCSMKP